MGGSDGEWEEEGVMAVRGGGVMRGGGGDGEVRGGDGE